MSDEARPPRFFVPAQDAERSRPGSASEPLGSVVSAPLALQEGREVQLPPTEAHHAVHVLRLREGAVVELFDGRGGAAAGRIARAKKGAVVVTIQAVRAAAARPQPILHLEFAVPKGSRLDWLLEKAAELGVASLRPVLFERSLGKAGAPAASAPARTARWQGHLIAAAKQAGLDFLPDIRPTLPLAQFLSGAAGEAGLYGDVSADGRPLAAALAPYINNEGRGGADCGTPALGRANEPKSTAEGGCATDKGSPSLPGGLHIVVGPEGGLTDRDRAILRQSGFIPVRLGRTTLRVETAAVALVAATVALWPEG